MTNTDKLLQPLLTTIKALRADNGCPWDKKQTSQSLVKYLCSEFNELLEAIDSDDTENICEELGDLLYILIMYAEIHASLDKFSLRDVITQINEKLIRRHPHVFAGKPYESEEQLSQQWLEIKAEEKKKNNI